MMIDMENVVMVMVRADCKSDLNEIINVLEQMGFSLRRHKKEIKCCTDAYETRLLDYDSNFVDPDNFESVKSYIQSKLDEVKKGLEIDFREGMVEV